MMEVCARRLVAILLQLNCKCLGLMAICIGHFELSSMGVAVLCYLLSILRMEMASSKEVPPKRAVLIDLSGTLHVGNQALPNAVEALRRLYSLSDRYSVKLVTNTTKESTNKLHTCLLQCGFYFVKKEDIFSSLSAARQLLNDPAIRPMLLLEPEAMEDFEDIDTSAPNVVVVGLAPSKFEFSVLNKAFKLLLSNKEARLIAIHKGRYYRHCDGMALGPGPFVECLEFSSGKKATVVGKPEREFFHQALRSCCSEGSDLSFDPSNALMIGDDVRDDVKGAIEAGMKACLVRTGKYRQGDELQLPEVSRNCVAADFASAVQLLIEGRL